MKKHLLPLLIFLIIAIIALYPLIYSNNYFRTIGIFIAIRAMVVVGLCLLMGYAGQASLGQAAFFAIGAYTSGIFTARYDLSPWLALIAGIVLSCFIALLIGWPSLKLHGHFLALATVSFGLIVYYLLKQWSGLTGGPSGLLGIPALTILDTRLKGLSYYYLVWIVLGLLLLLSHNIINSRAGRALRAIHDSETAAACMGVDTFALKLKLFMISAAYAAIAGSFYAHYVRFFSPTTFSFKVSIEFAIMAAVGGMASIWGGPLGVATVTALVELLRYIVPKITPAPEAVGAIEITLYGAIMVIIFIYMPNGLAGLLKPLKDRIHSQAQQKKGREEGTLNSESTGS